MLQVERLLADCADDARAGSFGALPLPADGAGYAAARRAFLAAGLAALREHLPDAGWVQLNLTPDASGPAGLHRRLAAAAGETLGSGLARDFFFMHKPPGVRARFRAAEPSLAGDLRTVLLRHLTPDQGAAAGQRPVATVYEPETYLFGGPRSMPHVHTLFTADSLAWLDLHTGAAGGQPPAAWRVSLTLLRTVFDRLGIDGWEHRGVWQAVRDETGRRLPGGLHDTALRRVADGIRAHWAEGAEAQLAALPEAWRNVLGPRLDGVARAAEQWRTRYFASGEATVGPRRAAAHHVIFHWNRGLVSTARQCLLTEALAADGHEGTE